MFCDPDLIERAVRKEYGDAIHDLLKKKGSIANLAKDEILDWCKEEIDKMPTKIREYNQSWIRKVFSHDEFRDAQSIIDSFTRLNWQEPLNKNKIPWKLVDGKAVLRRIRNKLQISKINLSEKILFNVMVEDDYDDNLKMSVNQIYKWVSDQS